MGKLNPVYELLRADGSIVLNKNLVFAIGINEAIMYSEILSKYNYFATRDELTEDGFFFNTVDNMMIDTGLGEKPQRNAIKKLKQLKLIDYKLKGSPPLRYFKIIDNVNSLLELIEKGRILREEIQIRLNEDIEKSKLRLLGGIKNSQWEELKTPKGSVNNTNPNNTKKNNTKVLHHLNPNDDIFIFNYLWIMSDFGMNHKPVSDENYTKILCEIADLKDSIDEEDWKEAVFEHFENLPKGNDGDINSFLKASRRYFG